MQKKIFFLPLKFSPAKAEMGSVEKKTRKHFELDKGKKELGKHRACW